MCSLDFRAILLGFLLLISSQSIAFCENVHKSYSSVESLRAEGDELLAKGLEQEALEKFKDSACLAELQKWPQEKLRSLLLEYSKKSSSRRQAYPLIHFFQLEYLRHFPILTEKDLLQLREVIKNSQVGFDHQNLDLIEKIGKQVSALSCESRTGKVAQVETLTDLSKGTHNSLVRPFLVRAVEVVHELDPPDQILKSQVLGLYMSNVGLESRQQQVEPTDTRRMREVLSESFDLMDSDKNINIQTEYGLQKLMELEDISSLIPLLRRQYERTKALSGKPEYYADSYADVGWAYISAGQLNDAERVFKEIEMLTRGDRFAESQYEFAQLSLAQCYMMQKKYLIAKNKLRSLMAFIADPSRADIRQFGSMAEAMLAEIYVRENNWQAARTHFEKADRGLILVETKINFPRVITFAFVKKQLPCDESVLKQLVNVYSKLGLDSKVQETQSILNGMRRPASTGSSVQYALKNVAISAPNWPYPKAERDIRKYREFLETHDIDKLDVAKELYDLSRICIDIGAIDEGQKCVNAALKQNLRDNKILQVQLLRNRAWLLILQRDNNARSILGNIRADSATSTNERFVAKWLISKSLLEDGKTDEAIRSLESITSYWRPKEDYLPFLTLCYCDLANALISDKSYAKAEALLKEYIVKGPKSKHGRLENDALPLSLLAYTEALQNKRSESELNLRASFEAPWQQRHGLLAANRLKSIACCYEALGDIDRARRFYYEALQEFEPTLMSSSHPDVVLLRNKIVELMPVLAG